MTTSDPLGPTEADALDLGPILATADPAGPILATALTIEPPGVAVVSGYRDLYADIYAA